MENYGTILTYFLMLRQWGYDPNNLCVNPHLAQPKLCQKTMKRPQKSLLALTANLRQVRLTQPRVTLREAREQAARVVSAAKHSPLRLQRSSNRHKRAG